tara:strand:- start:63 stop:839 length:777 start_codon:yes stop_codon:yes gene_type:complete
MKNQWFISIKKNEGELDLSNLKHNYPPKGYYWADPFLYSKDGKDYIFYELYDYKKGVIAYSEINDDMSFTDPTVILELDTHISYPFLIEDSNKLYMIPESGKDVNIKIYECTSFPNKWKFVKNIVPKAWTGDNNIIKLNNKYYLFTTSQPQLRHNLAILSSNSLLGEYKLEVNKEEMNSRSGGAFKIIEDKLIRFCQDSSNGYGSGIIIKSIELNDKEYNSFIMDEIQPNWHPDIFGTHHLDFNDKYIVIDGKRKIND